jgi:hypothetical protein
MHTSILLVAVVGTGAPVVPATYTATPAYSGSVGARYAQAAPVYQRSTGVSYAPVTRSPASYRGNVGPTYSAPRYAPSYTRSVSHPAMTYAPAYRGNVTYSAPPMAYRVPAYSVPSYAPTYSVASYAPPQSYAGPSYAAPSSFSSGCPSCCPGGSCR